MLRAWATLFKVIKHPIIQLMLGFILSWGLFFFVERKEVLPRYAVREPELLAEQTAEAPGLQLFWEGEEIENVYSTDIVVWNAGRQFLDEGSISSTDPLRVVYPSDIEILYAEFIRTSRATLKLNVIDRGEQWMNALVIDIVGDDALERGEGGLLRVLFVGPSSGDFSVTGRVKGSRGGPVEVEWDRAHTRRSWVAALATTGFTLVIVGVAVATSIRQFHEAEGHGVRRWLDACFTVAMAIALAVVMWFMFVHPALTALVNANPTDLFIAR